VHRAVPTIYYYCSTFFHITVISDMQEKSDVSCDGAIKELFLNNQQFSTQ